MPTAKKILNEIYTLREKSIVSVFDLDSTLFNVSTRTQKILVDFANDPTVGTKFGPQKERLKKIQVLHTDWGIRESLVRDGLEASLDFFEEVRSYWHKHFFSNEYLKYDVPYEGAIEYVKAIQAACVPVKYLTGRDRPNMFKGTVEGLKQWGLPLVDESQDLYMKPTKTFGEDEDYKVQILGQIAKEYEHIYFFENEPVIINRVLKSNLKVNIIFMDTVHSRREDVASGLSVIKGRFEV